MKNNYKKTLIACYLGFITQAISANFAHFTEPIRYRLVKLLLFPQHSFLHSFLWICSVRNMLIRLVIEEV